MKRLVVFLASVVLLTAGMQGWFAYNATYWTDVRFPASEAGLGGSNAPDVEASLGYDLFDNVQDEEVFFQVQLPHSYVLGTEIEAHVHWAKSTSAGGDVCWRVDYECKDIGETFANSLGTTISLTYEVDDADTAYLHAIADLTMGDPGFSGVSGMCIMRLWRDVSGDGASCADDYAADAILYEFDIHYQFDQPGSVSEWLKFQ